MAAERIATMTPEAKMPREVKGPERGPYRKLHRMTIEKMKPSGHAVEHHYMDRDGMGSHNAQTDRYEFGAEEGDGLAAHMMEHLPKMGVKMSGKDDADSQNLQEGEAME